MHPKVGAIAAAGVAVILSLFSALELYTLMGKNPTEDPYHVGHYAARMRTLQIPSGINKVGFVTTEQPGQSRNLLLFLTRYALAPVLVADSADLFPRVHGERDGVSIETKSAQ